MLIKMRLTAMAAYVPEIKSFLATKGDVNIRFFFNLLPSDFPSGSPLQFNHH